MSLDRKAVIDCLNQILEHELAGMVRYTQYSLMIFGHSRIPIISWMQGQATEAMDHAHLVGEEVTTLGGQVSLKIGALAGTRHTSIDDIMGELVALEESGIELYCDLLRLVENQDVGLEEFARQQIRAEGLHVNEIRKMLRNSGDA